MARSAVVVGSGPNGLVAAITLAEAGLDVVLHEAAPRAGGGMRTEELTLPGFRHDVCSAIHPLGRAFLRADVEWLESPACLAHPFDDDEAALLLRSRRETAAGLGVDAAAYRRLLRLPWPVLASAERVASRWFQGERARAFFAGNAAHSMLPLDTRPSAGFGLALLWFGHRFGWPFPRGGSQAIADALVARFRGELRLSSPVEELPRADVVVCDVSPRELLRLARWPARYERELQRYRYGPGAFKLDWALSGPIPWRDPRCAQAATVHLGGSFAEVTASEASPGSVAPFVLLAQPSLWDSSRAPAGQHTAWAYCHVPNGSELDMTEAIEAQVERFAPGFRSLILARCARGPAELAAHNRNLVGGDLNGGLMDLRQLWTRPARKLVPWRTPREGVYLCSASTPPGGGVHGLNGLVAAKLALTDLRLRRR